VWRLVISAIAVVATAPGFAQAQLRGIAAFPTAKHVSPDAFDDSIWVDARPTDALVQQEPDEGKPATLGTECRVIATPTALMFRFAMEQPARDVVARELRRDAILDNDDRVEMILDTNHDHRNAYYFATNPNGVRVDGLITEEQVPSLDWDTVWEVRVRRRAGGWDAIFTVPYAALTFPSDPEGVWGFNFSREIKRRTETDRWTGWQRPFSIAKVSLEGELRGVQSGHGRTLREVTPYAAGAVDHRGRPAGTSLLGKVGGDFRLGLGEASEADLTVNTDFAETEADTQQFNFGRTALFFPEKRQFFLQRAQTFAFGSAATTLPFFSRTIGLNGADPPVAIPIDAGLKATGRWGATDFGALAVQTRAASGDPRTDFFVGRVKQDLGHASYVGALFTDRERANSAASLPWSRTYGADAGLSLTPEWNASGFFVQTRNPGVSGETSAWNAQVDYRGSFANGELRRTDIGSRYLPQMGFVELLGIHETFADLELTPRPQVLGLRSLGIEGFYDFKYNENGTLVEREYQYTFRAEWLSGAYSDNDIVDVFDENLTEPLVLTEHVSIRPGIYHFVRHQIAAGSDPTRSLAFQVNFNFGEYYGGTRNRYVGRIFWKPSEHIGASLIEDYNVVRLPEGNFNLSLFSFRFDWNASTRWITSAIVQSDNVDRLSDVQVISRWLVDPATDVFAVVDRQIGAGFARPGTKFVVKIRRSFNL
jgi:hypothetical protein